MSFFLLESNLKDYKCGTSYSSDDLYTPVGPEIFLESTELSPSIIAHKPPTFVAKNHWHTWRDVVLKHKCKNYGNAIMLFKSHMKRYKHPLKGKLRINKAI